MSKFVFSRPLGDDLSPFGFSAKSMAFPAAALIGAAGIAAGTSLGQSGLQHYENVRQQHFEDDQARLAYERQQELMRQEFDYSKQLWEANNEYNSPKNQVKLLREAGLNPYVYSHGSDIGTGTSGSPASSPTAPSVAKGSGSAAAMPAFHDVGSLIMEGSALKNDKMRSFAQLVEAYPKILEACDGDVKRAASIVKQLAGISGLKGDKLYGNIVNQYNKQEAEAVKAGVEANLAQKYGDRQASNMIAQSEAIINESFARVRKMASDANVNDATIEEIGSKIARNVAEAWKLRKEGNKYVADAATVNALRKYLVSQARSQSNMMDLESLLSGAEPDTDLNDFFTSGEFMHDIKEGTRITKHWNASPIYRGFDKFFGNYIKIMGSASVSDH